jgi:DNA-binding NarL/FixJ family response regulator
MREKKILILEDEIIVALDLQELLEEQGFKTLVVHTFSDGMKQLKQFKPHLVICDINLGSNENGIEFAKQVKLNYPQIEIIFVTAFTSNQILEEAQGTEPFNYIVKPWNDEQIKVTINIAFKYIEEQAIQNSVLKELSLSEYKILDLIAKQKKSKEIAEMLFISDKTVRNHRYNIIKKLNLPNDNNSLLKWAITHLNK